MSTSLEPMGNMHSLDSMNALRQSVTQSYWIKNDVEEDEFNIIICYMPPGHQRSLCIIFWASWTE
jgi:hypothetical protein